VETLSNEDDVLRESRSGSFYRRYKIQEVIKRNQIVLVQVIKEERGNKGVSLTTYMSLAGRYCVLMPNSPKAGGISRKISSGDDRRRLREISADLKTIGGMSAIIRTAGIDRDRVEIQRDYEYLVKLWSNIREQTLASNAPALIYEEGDIIKRTIRDLYINDIEEIIVAGEEGFKQAHEFLSKILPTGQNTMVKLYQDNVPLFHAYNIEDQLNSMYDPAVKLRSGGYIVINPTEALISIDVNSGRATGERNIEETAVKTNLEAASEVARQLRLRDLAGLIVIDFIDMNDSRNRRSVERAVKDALKQDRAKIQIGRISAFGLLEMSRQRLRPSISESSTVTCTHCHGKGVIRSNSSVALQIIRSLEKEASQFGVAELRLFVTTSCAIVLLNGRRDEISNIEKKYEIKIITIADDSIPHGNFRIEKIKNMRRSNNNVRANEPVSFEQALDENIALAQEGLVAAFDIENAENIKPETGDEPRRNKRNRRNRKPRPQVADAAVLDNENNTAVVEEVVASEDSPKPRDENRPPRPKRAKHWNDRRSKFKENKNSEGSVASENSSSHAETSQPEIKNNNVEAPAASQENAKPKKGWWRRMVEA
ncbi:MAG: Rne/Rng family ribonuclease, partial [Pseudomonadota bacterium]